LLAVGNEVDARDHLEALVSRDATAPFARLARQLWDQYSMTAQLRAACAQVQPDITAQAGPVLQTLRAAGASVDPATVCSVG
ncbi:MAG: hypothetical protein M3336_09010, partial [Chloroflexota bacterium]|nr:hypothetical protein [Chloroflexota bacterium]